MHWVPILKFFESLWVHYFERAYCGFHKQKVTKQDINSRKNGKKNKSKYNTITAALIEWEPKDIGSVCSVPLALTAP
ncbi:MAG: hypothetical protein M3232_05105 [Thermoproteota archaeon]|nr:hypothetical protein [Thermoproteota archaeon]